MIIKGSAIPEVNFRKGYEIGDAQEQIDHFAMRITTPANPFEPKSTANSASGISWRARPTYPSTARARPSARPT